MLSRKRQVSIIIANCLLVATSLFYIDLSKCPSMLLLKRVLSPAIEFLRTGPSFSLAGWERASGDDVDVFVKVVLSDKIFSTVVVCVVEEVGVVLDVTAASVGMVDGAAVDVDNKAVVSLPTRYTCTT